MSPDVNLAGCKPLSSAHVSQLCQLLLLLCLELDIATTNTSTGTNVYEIADGIYRINTPVDTVPGRFSFNQYLIPDEQPLPFHSVPLCSQIAAMVSVNDFADRPAHAMADGEKLPLGMHAVKWLDAAHLPHGLKTSYLMESGTKTMFCEDLFVQGGIG